jgi:uncharacterized membrane protein YhiD involved in acid resistance
VAAIGMSVGVGWYEPGLAATAMALLTLLLLSRLERILPQLPTPIQVQLRITIARPQQGAVRDRLDAGGWTVRRGQIERVGTELVRLIYWARMAAGTDQDLDRLIAELQALEGLQEIGWEVLEASS